MGDDGGEDGTPKKRKLQQIIESSSSEFEIDQSGPNAKFPYILDQMKAIQKKLDSTTKDECIELKGKSNNVQIVVSCNTATFELIKLQFKSHIQAQGFHVSEKFNRDSTNNIVTTIYTVKSSKKAKTVSYTANFYHTTSRIHVNSIQDIDSFLSQYTSMINQIPTNVIDELNQKIRKSCENAMQTAKSKKEQQVQRETSTNFTNNRELEDGMDIHSHSSDSFSSIHSTHQNSTISSLLRNKPINSDLIDEILNRLVAVEAKQIEMSTQIKYLKAENLSLKEKLRSADKQTNTNTYSFVASKNISQQSNISSCKHSNDPSTSQAAQNFQPSQNHAVSRNITQSKEIKYSFLPSFQPEKCIVVSCTKNDIESFKKLNRDNIRRDISTYHGPIIIDLINKYKHQSINPRFIIQFSSKETATKVVKNWKEETFGGSSVRVTIDPSETRHVGMVRGIPIDVDESTIKTAISTHYNGATFERLFKDGKPLRTIKITFTNNLHMTNAVNNGLLIESINMLFRIEQPYSNNHHGK